MRLRHLSVSAATAVVLAATLLPAGDAVADDTHPLTGDSAFTIQGHGYGHGRGLSQYGARGAARQGLSYRQIVDFYYPGTSWGRSKGRISVLITADTDNALVVDARTRLTLRAGNRSIDLTMARATAKKWRIKRASNGRSRLEYRTDRWRLQTRVKGEPEFFAGGQPITLRLPGGSGVAYRGMLRSTTTPGSRSRDTVNVLPMDSYLKGVVADEMPASWEPQALRAQAVAARTYASYEIADSSPRICDTTACQVYGGYSAEQPQTNRAVEATARKILTYDGKPAFTQFSSSNGGWTAAGAFPYLTAKQDPYEAGSDNPSRTWTVPFTGAEIEAQWPQVGDLRSITFSGRDGNGEWGGRVGTVTITGDSGSTRVTGEDFRFLLELRSTWLTIAP